jgi:hypothetical protein
LNYRERLRPTPTSRRERARPARDELQSCPDPSRPSLPGLSLSRALPKERQPNMFLLMSGSFVHKIIIAGCRCFASPLPSGPHQEGHHAEGRSPSGPESSQRDPARVHPSRSHRQSGCCARRHSSCKADGFGSSRVPIGTFVLRRSCSNLDHDHGERRSRG